MIKDKKAFKQRIKKNFEDFDSHSIKIINELATYYGLPTSAVEEIVLFQFRILAENIKNKVATNLISIGKFVNKDLIIKKDEKSNSTGE